MPFTPRRSLHALSAASTRPLRALLALVLAGLSTAPSPAPALEPTKSLLQFPFRAWQTVDGLPQNAIQALAQTPDGYLWGGTWEGLVRFDGVRFTVYDHINTPQLQARTIRCLAIDPLGTLWIGTEAGLSGMRQGAFFAVSAPPDIPLRHVVALHATRDGSLWIATEGHGLLRFSQGQFQHWDTSRGLASDRVKAIVEDAAGTLWIGTTRGVQRWEGSGPGAPIPFEGAFPPVFSLAAAADGTLWAGTEEGSVYQLQGGLPRHVPEASLPGAPIEVLLVDQLGTLWVGSTGNGLLRLAHGQRFTLNASQGLLSSAVAALLEDAEGNLWIGAAEGGLQRLKDAPFTSVGRPEGLPHDVVISLHEARDGSLWVASFGGGVTRWRDGEMSTWTTREGLIHDRVRSIAEAPDGSLWFTAQTGLSQWKDGAITTSLSYEHGLPSGPVRVAHVEDDGTLWAGTLAGLARWNGQRFELLKRQHGLPGDTITLLQRRPAGGFWVGTGGGGLAYFLHGRPTTLAPEGDPMISEVAFLHEEPNGTLWIGTDEGLYRWRAGRFTRYTRAEGLFDDRIFSILPDGRGYLWMSCNKGIFRVSQQELEELAEGRRERVTSAIYGTDDGMRAEECNGVGAPAGLRTRDGRLWFPTLRGVAFYDPSLPEKAQTQPPPPVLIEELRVDGLPVPASEWQRIPPNEGYVELHYTSPSLRAPQRLRFRYRLEGVDTDWVQADTRRVAYYTHLRPGAYRFRVRVDTTDGGAPPEETVQTFYLTPRLHERWGFRVALALALVLGGAGGVWLRLHRLRVRELRLQARVDERTAELATVNADLQARLQELHATRERLVHAEKMAAVGTLAAGVGHEINNPLSFIIANLHYATGEVQGAVRQPDKEKHWADVAQALEEALHGADRVRRIVQDLKTFSREQPDAARPLDLHAVLDLTLAIAEGELRHRARVVRAFGAPPPVLGDETRLGQVFLNLLINAAQAIPEGHAEQHEVRVSTRVDEQGHAVVAVSDSGGGIAPDVLPRIFEPFFTTKPVGVGTGLGLSICHSYVQGMGGEIRVHSEVGSGTTFEVVLPPAAQSPQRPAS